MIYNVKNINIYEYDPCGEISNIEELRKIENFLKRHNLESVFHFTLNSSFKTTSWVGIVKCGKYQIQILPKLLKYGDDNNRNNILRNLIFMLSYVRKLEIKSIDSSILNKCKNPFLEILIREFANSLFESLKKYSPKSYIRQENNLNFLKGKLKISDNIRYNLTNQARFYCEYDEFSEDNMLNQLFYYVSSCLFNISQDNENKKILLLIKNFYSDISFIHFNTVRTNQVKLSRNQMIFEKPLKLAKMFIEHSFVDLSSNKIENIALLWDMNKLFEEFVFEIMRKYNKNGWKISSQKGRRLLKQDDSTKRNTFVDIYAYKENEKVILDTKYKKFEGLNDVSNGDIFQVSTYCLLHGAKKAILIYPQCENSLSIQYYLNTDNDINPPYEIQFKTINLMRNIEKDFINFIEEIKLILG